MIQIQDTLVSGDLLKQQFVCDLSKCKGICCVEGDSGAPLEEDELGILDDIYDDIKHHLRPEGKLAIEQQGKYICDEDGDWVTPLVNDQECAYVIFDENGVTKCGIEKAYEVGDTTFLKPISCHLYPVRVQKYKSFTAVNYHAWKICSDACVLGKTLSVSVADFVKNALIRKFGDDWYNELMEVKALNSKRKIF